MVSVPCRGLFYFIKHILIKKMLLNKFPSPAGVFFISSTNFAVMILSQVLSFRPLPGSFLFHPEKEAEQARLKAVSVPCRGLFYFIDIIFYGFWCIMLGFPSPAGVFFISSTKTTKKVTPVGFRPLPGSFLFHLVF